MIEYSCVVCDWSWINSTYLRSTRDVTCDEATWVDGTKCWKPMILECDNNREIGITNNWTFNGRTKHIDTRYHFLQELKEKRVITSQWTPGSDNSTGLFTKNLGNPVFTKHDGYYCTDEDFTVAK